MPLVIAPLNEQDLPQLIALQAELLAEPGDLPRMRALFRRLAQEERTTLLGAKINGELIGSLAAIVCDDLIGRCLPFMVIENVIVASAWRRTGAGRELMAAAERLARSRDCRYIMLVSAVMREHAPDFYHSLGYDSADYRGFKKILDER